MTKTLAIMGLGLMSGSLAKALREAGAVGRIVAWGRRETSLAKGLELGVIDAWSLSLDEVVAEADIVVIGTPTRIAETSLAQLKPLWRDNWVVTDVASAKGNLVRAATELFGEVPPNFVPGHPIAGSEQSGVEAARGDLFRNRRVILTPVATTDAAALETIRAMWSVTGAEVLTMDVDRHDQVLAATSHLPHMLAYGLVDALARDASAADIFRFSAGGFRDFTRIASSDPAMWHDIVLANRDAVLASLDDFTRNLDRIREAIADGDGEQLMSIFGNAKQARDAYLALQIDEHRETENEA